MPPFAGTALLSLSAYSARLARAAMAALAFDVAATLIQKRVRGRRTRQRYLLQQLAFLVQSHYRDPHARIDAVDLACALGAVRRLEGRLWKKSSQFPKFQERQVWVDDLQLKYSMRTGDQKTIDLAQIDRIAIHSEERREFALCTRNGRSYTFRADTKENFAMWTTGLEQFMGMARAYYALS